MIVTRDRSCWFWSVYVELTRGTPTGDGVWVKTNLSSWDLGPRVRNTTKNNQVYEWNSDGHIFSLVLKILSRFYGGGGPSERIRGIGIHSTEENFGLLENETY